MGAAMGTALFGIAEALASQAATANGAAPERHGFRGGGGLRFLIALVS
jgi:hypothetical protein